MRCVVSNAQKIFERIRSTFLFSYLKISSESIDGRPDDHVNLEKLVFSGGRTIEGQCAFDLMGLISLR